MCGSSTGVRACDVGIPYHMQKKTKKQESYKFLLNDNL